MNAKHALSFRGSYKYMYVPVQQYCTIMCIYSSVVGHLQLVVPPGGEFPSKQERVHIKRKPPHE